VEHRVLNGPLDLVIFANEREVTDRFWNQEVDYSCDCLAYGEVKLGKDHVENSRNMGKVVAAGKAGLGRDILGKLRPVVARSPDAELFAVAGLALWYEVASGYDPTEELGAAEGGFWESLSRQVPDLSRGACLLGTAQLLDREPISPDGRWQAHAVALLLDVAPRALSTPKPNGPSPAPES
jgi:hypothetical protein